MKKIGAIFLGFGAFAFIISCAGEQETDAHSGATKKEVAFDKSKLKYSYEHRLEEIQQLTNGGDNAEAYFSPDDSKLVFQRTNPKEKVDCDQIYVADVPGFGDVFEFSLVSTGRGRTTCSYFMPEGETIVYASTHERHDKCPPVPDRKKIGKYVWPLYPEFEIYTADLGGNIIAKLTDNNSYDAEATVSPNGDKIVFTSTRNGDIDLYTMNLDGSEVTQITFDVGYDGGAFFSADGSQLVWRASRPKPGEEEDAYKDFLKKDMVTPSDMELFVANADGSEARQVTNLGGANWAPFWHPSGEKIVFSSNHQSESGFPFNLFMVEVESGEVEQITFDTMFDAFPMFSHDGTKLVWSSNRNNGGTRETNLFLAHWIE